MGWEFKTDLSLEKPFYDQMVDILKGRKTKQRINDCETWLVKCPTCGCMNAGMITTRNKETYALVCPNRDKCSRREILLHTLIRDYGSADLFLEWRQARWESKYTEDWFPIKNRRLSERRKKHTKTFRESQQLKSDLLLIKLTNMIKP